MVGGCTLPHLVPLHNSSSGGPPKRIISLAPSVTELLFALGAGSQVVACTQFCNYPPEVRGLPRIGDMQIDLERVVGLGPQLIVAESITSDAVVRRLEGLGLRVVRVDSRTLDGYARTLHVLGDETGHADQARLLVTELQNTVRSLRVQTAAIPLKNRRRVFVEIWGRPLQTAGAGTFLDEIIQLVGGVNIFHDFEAYPQVSPEAVVARDPQVVLLTTTSRETFESWQPFRGLMAVRRGAVYALDPDTLVRPTPRLVKSINMLHQIVSP